MLKAPSSVTPSDRATQTPAARPMRLEAAWSAASHPSRPVRAHAWASRAGRGRALNRHSAAAPAVVTATGTVTAAGTG